MQENVQQEENTISLMDIFRLLLSKIKFLVLVALVAAIAGGALGLYTSWNDLRFGTQVEFYVNPKESTTSSGENSSQYGVYGSYSRNAMDNMVKLLASESFTEELLLNGEVLPQVTYVAGETTPLGEKLSAGETWSWLESKDVEAQTQLAAAVQTATELRSAADKKQAELDAAVLEKTEKTLAQNRSLSLINDQWSKVYPTYTSSANFNETACEDLIERAKTDEALATAIGDLKLYYESWLSAKQGAETATNTIKTLNDEYFNKAVSAEKTALNLWRNTDGYKEVLKKYSKAITYSYLAENTSSSDANNLARSFIYVKISVTGKENQDFAEEALLRVRAIVPGYVEANMSVPSGYEGTNCQRITRTDEIKNTNPNHRLTETIKFAILLGLATLVVAAVIIIIIDKSDKRIRDTEVITKKFNVPVLGVVPTIEELQEELYAKKLAAEKAAKTSKKEAK